LSRRSALLLGCAVLCAACGPRPEEGDAGDGGLPDGSNGPDSAAPDASAMCGGDTDVGAVSDFPVGSQRVIAASALIVGRDADGLYAMSARCTHNQQALRIGTDGQIHCVLTTVGHRSIFDVDGHRISGAARRDLPNYQVSVCDGRVRVDRRVIVAAGTRTPVE
jgi:nitrite reductase/ring-hydroxylating ferredoxin subunit